MPWGSRLRPAGMSSMLRVPRMPTSRQPTFVLMRFASAEWDDSVSVRSPNAANTS